MSDTLIDIQMQVMWNRLLSVVEEQARTLVRTAFSTSAREAGDITKVFNCKINGAAGASAKNARLTCKLGSAAADRARFKLAGGRKSFALWPTRRIYGNGMVLWKQ